MNLSSKLNIKSNFSTKMLVSHLQSNLDKHIEEYDKAIEVYNKDVHKALIELLNITNTMINVNTYSKSMLDDVYYKVSNITKPIDAVSMYNEYITLLDLSVDENIELTLNEANAIINDSWDWATAAKLINGSYAMRSN